MDSDTEETYNPISSGSNLHNKVLVIGSAAVGKKHLLKQLLKSTSLSVDSGSTVLWPISTKYYKATLEFHLLSTADYDFNEDNVREVCSEVANGCQGVILLHNVFEAASLAAVKPWAAFVDAFEPSVALCVGSFTRAGTPVPVSSVEDARDWAAEAGLEYVELPFDAESKAHDIASRGLLDEEEKEGSERVREALLCNMWTNLKLAAKQPTGAGASVVMVARDPASAVRSDDLEPTAPSGLSAPLTSSQPTPAPSAVSVPASELPSSKEPSATPVAMGPAPPPSIPQPSQSASAEAQQRMLAALGALGIGGAEEAEDEDPQMDKFMKAFEMIQRTRAQVGTLSDEERRKQASDTMMQLMQWFGDEDEEEES